MVSLIKNVRIIGPDRIVEGQQLIIEDGYIKGLTCQSTQVGFDQLIDGAGLFLAPGFIDIHSHGNSGYDVMDASKKALDAMGDYHISKGVTSYLASIITASKEDMLRAAKMVADYKNSPGRAELLGIHLEGPFFRKEKKGAQPEEHLIKPDKLFIEELLDLAGNKLRMVSLAPELEGSLELIDYLRARGVKVGLGHTQASYNQALDAIDRGASIATHLYNGMGPFDHREPGLVGACLTDDRVYCELIYDRIHVHDAAASLAIKAKGSDGVILISDAMMAAGLEDVSYLLGGQEVFVKDGVPRLASGALGGSTLNLQRAVQNSHKYLDMPIVEAIKMASLNPARALDFYELGSIEAGKKADFLFLDEDLNIKRVYKAGVLAYEEK